MRDMRKPGRTRISYMSLSERLTHYSRPGENGCVLWTGYLNRSGYGVVGYNYKSILAHRAAWEVSRGAIPEGLLVCHTCDVRNCINPDHLFVGTNADNMVDKIKKGRAWSKLSPIEVAEIRANPGVTKPFMRKFGVSGTIIRKIRSGEDWKHLGRL